MTWIAMASMYKSVEGTLANIANMSKQYWSNIAKIMDAIDSHKIPHV